MHAHSLPCSASLVSCCCAGPILSFIFTLASIQACIPSSLHPISLFFSIRHLVSVYNLCFCYSRNGYADISGISLFVISHTVLHTVFGQSLHTSLSLAAAYIDRTVFE